MKEYYRIAKRMLGEVPEELADRLYRVRELIREAKPEGDLLSTQAIAIVIEQWEREKRGS